MDYFEAVQLGRRRVNEAVALLQPIAGPCYPMLFLKIGISDWTPVGEDNHYALVYGKNGTVAVGICDSDGNVKTMSSWVTAAKAADFAAALGAKGVVEFSGDVKLPV